MHDMALRSITGDKGHRRRFRQHPQRAVVTALMVTSTLFAVVVSAPLADASAHSSGSWALIGADPWPGISSFGGVSCPTTSDCWVVGTTQGGQGAILATTNGRKSW